jgi:hypothetical protein
MDCHDARLLAQFVRTGELSLAERRDLDDHFLDCPECKGVVEAENRLDDAFELAMLQVPVPAGLKGRILERLTRAHRPRPWRWVATAAALMIAALGYLAFYGYHEEFDTQDFVNVVDDRAGLPRETVEQRFNTELGIAMRAPKDFNFNLLDSFDSTEVHGRRVAKLTFFTRGEAGAALAHVYVLPASQFKLPADQDAQSAKADGSLAEIIPASKHNFQIRRYPDITDFFFVIVYTSGTLDPFLFHEI